MSTLDLDLKSAIEILNCKQSVMYQGVWDLYRCFNECAANLKCEISLLYIFEICDIYIQQGAMSYLACHSSVTGRELLMEQTDIKTHRMKKLLAMKLLMIN